MQPLRGSQCSPFLWGDYRRLAFRRRGRLLSRLRSAHPSSGVAGETPALFAEQSAFGGCLASAAFAFPLRRLPPPNVSQARRLLSRLRSALPSSGVAGEDACCPGCAAFTLPLGSQARRLRSLRSKAPSAVAGLRSVPFGGCRAALRSPLPLTSYLLPLTFYLLPFTSYLLPLTSYLLPLTSYLLPLTFYLLPLTSYLLPFTSYLLPVV